MNTAASTNDTICPNPACLLTELGDGTGVLLDLDTKFYFTLNETGLFVWKTLLAAEGSSPQALAKALTEAFEVTPEQAERDVDALVGELRAAALVRAGNAVANAK